MSPIETKQLQAEIKHLLKEVGWDLNKLAKKLIDERNDPDDDNLLRKEYEKLKKAFNRPTTKAETLHFYLNFIIEHNQKRQLYKIPSLDLSHFTQEDQIILESVKEKAKLIFSENENS